MRGLEFVAHLRRTQPWRRVDDAFRRPPRSTEQILHPELDLADEKPHVITAVAPPGMREVHQAVWGEAGWSMFYETHGVAPATAMSAAAGWGGDRVLLVAATGDAGATAAPVRTTGLALLTFDTALDATEAWAALTHALDALVIGAEISSATDRHRWLDATGRITAAERTRRGHRHRHRRAAAGVAGTLDGVWTWKVVGAPPPPSPGPVTEPEPWARRDRGVIARSGETWNPLGR
ncbi:MAG: hypothetical protein HS111_06345 [Kofleriaceae bacterium]|nr:hypothetical protein [Kofleriaceae bacterium]